MIRDADDMLAGQGLDDGTVRRRSAALSALLTSLDPSDDDVAASAAAIRRTLAAAPRPRWYRNTALLRAAAMIAVVLGIVAVVPPARAWVVERARAAAALLGRDTGAETTGARATGDARPAGAAAVYSFTVPGDVFEIDARGAIGTLHLSAGGGTLASAEASGAGVVVLPGALRIETPTSRPVTVRVTLPGYVTTVRVRLDGGVTRELELPAGGEDVSIALDAPA